MLPKRWKLAVIAVGVGAVAIYIATRPAADPLRQSDAGVRSWLLSTTPLGSDLVDVRSILERHGWHDERFQQARPRPAAEPFLGGEIGSYQGLPWHTSVRAFWEFDGDNRLVDIRIERILDSP